MTLMIDSNEPEYFVRVGLAVQPICESRCLPLVLLTCSKDFRSPIDVDSVYTYCDILANAAQ